MITKYLFVNFICLFPFLMFSQIPTILAVCGEGQNIDWAKIKEETERQELEEGGGPGFFYNDCDQGVNPIKASSTLINQGRFNYRIKNINDNDPMTAWVEGKADYGIGEFFEIKAAGINTIYNGYQFSPKSWIENSRVKKFKVYRNNIAICYLELTDEMGRQSFELPGHNSYNPLNEFIFKFEILEVYKGSKWKDVAISEINLGLCCISELSLINTPTNSVNISNLQDVSRTTSLTFLSFSMNLVKNFDLTKNIDLTYLECFENEFDV